MTHVEWFALTYMAAFMLLMCGFAWLMLLLIDRDAARRKAELERARGR